MKTRFKAIIQRSDDDDQLEAVYVPSLDFHCDFTKFPDELKLCKTLGQQYYLENKIAEIVKIKKALQEKIEDSSTMALMTQGFSELSGASNSYDMYFVKNLKDIKPSNIDGVAIFIVGEDANRSAYLISNNEFYCVKKKKWNHCFILSLEQLKALEHTEFDPNHPTPVTIYNCFVISVLKKTIVKEAGWIYLGPNSYPLDIFISDTERRPCHFFTTIFPPFTRFTMVAGFTMSTLLNLGIVDSMPNPLFPPIEVVSTNSTTGNSTITMEQNPYLRPFNIAQTGLGYVMMLAFVYIGQRTRTLSGLGLQIDDFFINLYRKFFGPKVDKNKKETKGGLTWLDIKIKLTTGGLFVLVLNQAFLMGLWNYLRLTMISDTVSQAKNPMFSPEFIKDVAIGEWALQQATEPALIFSECVFMIYLVKYLFKPTNLLKQLQEQAKEDRVDDEKIKPVNEIKNENNIIDFLTSPDQKGLASQKGIFSNKTIVFPDDVIAYTPPVSQVGLLGSNNASFPKSREERHTLTERLLP